MSKDTKTFYVTKTAPPKILGQRHKGPGSPIELTEKQSVHLLRTLQVTKDKPAAKPAPKKDEDQGSKPDAGKTGKSETK